MRKVSKKVRFVFNILVSMLLPVPCFASLGGNDIATALNNLVDLITGEIGTTLCTLAIIGVGFAWLKFGKIEKEIALSVILGIGIIYSASYLAITTLGAG